MWAAVLWDQVFEQKQRNYCISTFGSLPYWEKGHGMCQHYLYVSIRKRGAMLYSFSLQWDCCTECAFYSVSSGLLGDWNKSVVSVAWMVFGLVFLLFAFICATMFSRSISSLAQEQVMYSHMSWHWENHGCKNSFKWENNYSQMWSELQLFSHSGFVWIDSKNGW